MGFEPTTTSLGSTLGSPAMGYAATPYATGSQHYHTITATARYRPQQQDTGATVTKTGMYRWNRDGNRNDSWHSGSPFPFQIWAGTGGIVSATVTLGPAYSNSMLNAPLALRRVISI
jgi:hypothetical protein